MRHRGFKDILSLGQLQRDLLTGVALFLHILTPAGELVGPGFDPVAPASDAVGAEAGDPAVVVVKGEGRLAPGLVLEGVLQRRGNDIMAVPENIGPDSDLLADHPLRRITAAVDLGPDTLDQDARLGPPFGPMRGLRMRPVPPPGFDAARRLQRGT